MNSLNLLFPSLCRVFFLHFETKNISSSCSCGLPKEILCQPKEYSTHNRFLNMLPKCALPYQYIFYYVTFLFSTRNVFSKHPRKNFLLAFSF